ncbi:type III secretion protein [Brenneria rubrifaciens]|uniref:Type III secretion protein n=1 Tax=Brenneria rubrifaciens TaxID=55213 RepID=A0A4P8QT29_9GAMM|nr:type III secretion protein [Brenneria rubrifaciens]QCR08550.1 type III secretion protein [Brenneria rubrifaciens]
MIEHADVFTCQEDFIEALAHTPAGRWIVRDGVTIDFYRLAGSSQGVKILLCLMLARGRCYPGQIRQVLQQRFQEAETLGECYLSMDLQQQLILRRTLPASEQSYPQAITDMLKLSGLPSS